MAFAIFAFIMGIVIFLVGAGMLVYGIYDCEEGYVAGGIFIGILGGLVIAGALIVADTAMCDPEPAAICQVCETVNEPQTITCCNCGQEIAEDTNVNVTITDNRQDTQDADTTTNTPVNTNTNTRYCTYCGNAVELIHKFCSSCGEETGFVEDTVTE